MRNHRCLTLLLNILLAGRTCVQPRRSRHLWAIVPGDASFEAKWVQEYFFAKFGEAVVDSLSPLSTQLLKMVDPTSYFTTVVHDGRGLQLPADLDDLICCYDQLSAKHRAALDRACFWMDMASRQWTISLSGSFASLVIAIEALGDRSKGMGSNSPCSPPCVGTSPASCRCNHRRRLPAVLVRAPAGVQRAPLARITPSGTWRGRALAAG
jgi:hypothetical protein